MTTAELVESAVLTEASPLISAGQDSGTKGIWRTRIIQADVQGSSGYYPAEVLMRDGPTAFPAGTHVYLDHPTSDEDEERPERSVKDLAGYLVDAARFEEGVDGRGLFARIQFIDELKDRIKSLAPVIGLSIRASGDVESQPGGQRVVRSIAHGLSVDVVTRAGAGGRLVNMTESTAPESPPADQKNATLSENSGTGTNSNAVASKVDVLTDQIEKLHESIVRIGHALTEQQKITTQLAESSTKAHERIISIDNRQSIADKAIGEATQVGEVAAALAESRLPLASQMRLAANYRPGQDIHKEIQGEREYTKKVVRESVRGEGGGAETSGLGLIESTTVGSVDLSSSASAEDFSEMDAVLSGKLY